jgi:asparagine synthase (glutamine-hydrolysing)
MSGFVGVFMRDGEPPASGDTAAMAASTPYRGADGCREVLDGPFRGRELNTITSPEGEHAPPGAGESRAFILFDGRLDNRDELGDALGISRPALRACSDASLARAAWQRWSEDAPAHLAGDFAFVIWDRRERSLLCARDPMGVRPLFYWLSDRAFVFGSELRQVLAHRLVPQSPHEAMVARLLAGELPRASDWTLYRGVHRLPHAHRLVVTADRVRIARYWALDLGRELKLRRDDDYAEAFRELFDRAVEARLRSRGPIGAYLSGGLDSSSVVVAASALGARERPGLTTFSLVFPGQPEADERQYSEAVLRRTGVTGVDLRPQAPSGGDFRAQVASGRELPDFPHDCTGNAVRAAMRARGIHVALTGTGGDTSLSGSHFYYADLLRAFRLRMFWRRYRDVARQPGMGWTSADLLEGGVWPLLPVFARHALRPLARRARGAGVPPWVRTELASRVGLDEVAPLRRIPAGQLARTDVHDGLENGWTHMALDMYQRGSAQWGIEDRHPFLDRRVVEFVLSLPDEQRWQRGQTRYVVRRAYHTELPTEVRDRPAGHKGDFSHVYIDALDAIGGRSFFSGPLVVAANGWIVPSVLCQMYDRMRSLHRAGDPSYGDVAFRLWNVAALEMWYSEVFSRGSGAGTWSSDRKPIGIDARNQPAHASHMSVPG